MFFDPTILQQCAPKVSQVTMKAIIKTESNGFPWAIGINKGYKLRYQPKSKAQAVSWVRYLEKNNYNFDVGLGQINIKNIHQYGYKAEDALDPCTNLKMASDILVKNYNAALTKSSTTSSALQKAISAYNTGNYSSGFSNGYVGKVFANAKAPLLVAENDNIPPLEATTRKSSKSKNSRISQAQKNNQDPQTSKTLLYMRGANAAAAFY